MEITFFHFLINPDFCRQKSKPNPKKGGNNIWKTELH